jgi:hypothetical protein
VLLVVIGGGTCLAAGAGTSSQAGSVGLESHSLDSQSSSSRSQFSSAYVLSSCDSSLGLYPESGGPSPDPTVSPSPAPLCQLRIDPSAGSGKEIHDTYQALVVGLSFLLFAVGALTMFTMPRRHR